MNKPIKIKTIQVYKDSTGEKNVCKGILKRIEVFSSGQICPLGLTDSDEYTYKYIVISEVEKIEENDWAYNSYSKRMYLMTPTNLNYARYYENTQIVFKIIVLPKQFSPETLQAITDGVYDDGDEVFVECEWKRSGRPTEFTQIKLTDNYVNVFPIKKPMLVVKGNMYSVMHQQFATDRYEFRTTIVEASNKEEAMKKLNEYLATEPDGVYTGKPCEKLEYVSELEYLS